MSARDRSVVTVTALTASGILDSSLAKRNLYGFVGYDLLFPVFAIVDPELMATVSPKFTLASRRKGQSALCGLTFCIYIPFFTEEK